MLRLIDPNSLGAVILIIWLLPILRRNLPNDYHDIAVLLVAFLVILKVRALRRSVVQALILAFCIFATMEFVQWRQDLRKKRINTTEIVARAAGRVWTSKYVQDAQAAVWAIQYHRYLGAIDPFHAEVNTFAKGLVRGTPNHKKAELVQRVFKWVTEEVQYISDPDMSWGKGDYVKPPLQTIESKAGDCDDTSVLLASLLEALGLKTYLIFIPKHVFVLVELDPSSSNAEMGKPFGHIGGRPVYALESTRDRPRIGPPAGADTRNRMIFESSTGRRVSMKSS